MVPAVPVLADDMTSVFDDWSILMLVVVFVVSYSMSVSLSSMCLESWSRSTPLNDVI